MEGRAHKKKGKVHGSSRVDHGIAGIDKKKFGKQNTSPPQTRADKQKGKSHELGTKVRSIGFDYSYEFDHDAYRMDESGNIVPRQTFEENWTIGKYVTDMHGYEIPDDHFMSEDEVSDDGDVACMTNQLSRAKIGKSHVTECISLPPHDPEDVFLLTFDGHRKKEVNGGYGALLRCANGQPVVAVAGGSRRSISAFYHTLEGFLAGLELAVLANVPAVFCACNSHRVFNTLSECFIFNSEGGCRRHPEDSFDLVCQPCLNRNLTIEERVDEGLFYEIVQKIVETGQQYYRDCGILKAYMKELNRPADFLAKLVPTPGEEWKLKPEQFPAALMALVNQHGGGTLLVTTISYLAKLVSCGGNDPNDLEGLLFINFLLLLILV
ncbi:uncharacterized protein LOC113281613 [Papaver somniferum]|nr:uncharacterized protein LOC113281613 [Papaver somniferum]